MVVLGVSGFEDVRKSKDANLPIQFFPLSLIGHDPSATLFVDGKLVASAAEERFTRIKHGYNLAGKPVLPRRAMRYCLDEAGLDWRDVDYWAHYCRFTPESVAARLARVTRQVSAERRKAIEAEYRETYRNRLDPEVVRNNLETISGVPIPYDRFAAVPRRLHLIIGLSVGDGETQPTDGAFVVDRDLGHVLGIRLLGTRHRQQPDRPERDGEDPDRNRRRNDVSQISPAAR